MASRARPYSPYEQELFDAVQLLVGSEDLPDISEVERGGLLWLVREAWRHGGHRDGRAGHLTDNEVAEEIQKRVDIPFDRNRFQAMFGRGKKAKDRPRYFQPVPKEVARAFMDVALKHWDAPDPRDEKNPLAGFGSFAQFDNEFLDRAIERAVSRMYPDQEMDPDQKEKPVLCRKPLGLGPKALYRQLGDGAFSVVVLGREEAFQMADPDSQIRDMGQMINLLLCRPRAERESNLHIWALREPDFASWPEREMSSALVRPLRARTFLRAVLDVLTKLNEGHPKGWTYVPLERCVIATQSVHAEAEPAFAERPPETWQLQGVPLDPKDSIPIFCVNPEGETRFYNFAAERDLPNIAPFVKLTDPGNGLGDYLLDLVDNVRAILGNQESARMGDWTLQTVRHFISQTSSTTAETMS